MNGGAGGVFIDDIGAGGKEKDTALFSLFGVG